jgi:lipid-A-disaccharide synthase
MTPKRFMLIAGEASGDILAAELVGELRAAMARISTYSVNVQPLRADLAPRFFGAGGPAMANADVELAFDLTQKSLIGIPGPRDCLMFLRRVNELVALACEREPHVIICVDFQFFNSFFAAAIKRHVRSRRGTFNNWEPKIIKYISPQVWASREGRARKIARDFDLVLSIVPFEKKWYAERVPGLRVEFIGHPLVERYGRVKRPAADAALPASPKVVLLPGSRKRELERHWPVMLTAWQKIQTSFPSARAKVIVPGEALAAMARSSSGQPVQVQVGGLAEALAEADLAISKTGTITMECAFFGVPTVTMYIASGVTYQIGRRLVKVKWASMPNLIANEAVFPEFIQHDATPDNISHAALQLLQNQPRREKVRAKLAEVIASLGTPGASRRAAEAILAVMG